MQCESRAFHLLSLCKLDQSKLCLDLLLKKGLDLTCGICRCGNQTPFMTRNLRKEIYTRSTLFFISMKLISILKLRCLKNKHILSIFSSLRIFKYLFLFRGDAHTQTTTPNVKSKFVGGWVLITDVLTWQLGDL